METSATNGGAQAAAATGSKSLKTVVDRNGRSVKRWVSDRVETGRDLRVGKQDSTGPKLKSTDAASDVRSRSRKNSNGNVKRGEVRRQRNQNAAREILKSPQAKNEPGAAVENYFSSAVPEASAVEVDGPNVKLTMPTGAEVSLRIDADDPEGFKVDDAAADALTRSLLEADDEAADQVGAEIAAVAEAIGAARDELTALAHDPLHGMSEGAREVVTDAEASPSLREVEESGDRGAAADLISRAIGGGAEVKEVTSDRIVVGVDSGEDVRLDVSKEGSGPPEVTASPELNERLRELATGIRRGDDGAEGMRAEAEEIARVLEKTREHLRESGDLYDEVFARPGDPEAEDTSAEPEAEDASTEPETEDASTEPEAEDASADPETDDTPDGDQPPAEEDGGDRSDTRDDDRSERELEDERVMEDYRRMTEAKGSDAVIYSNTLANAGVKNAAGLRLNGRVSSEKVESIRRALLEGDRARKIGRKESYTTEEAYYKMRAAIGPGDVRAAIRAFADIVGQAGAEGVKAAQSAASLEAFTRSAAGKKFDKLSNKKRRDVAGAINRVFDFKFGAISQLKDQSFVKTERKPG